MKKNLVYIFLAFIPTLLLSQTKGDNLVLYPLTEQNGDQAIDKSLDKTEESTKSTIKNNKDDKNKEISKTSKDTNVP